MYLRNSGVLNNLDLLNVAILKSKIVPKIFLRVIFTLKFFDIEMSENHFERQAPNAFYSVGRLTKM